MAYRALDQGNSRCASLIRASLRCCCSPPCTRFGAGALVAALQPNGSLCRRSDLLWTCRRRGDRAGVRSSPLQKIIRQVGEVAPQRLEIDRRRASVSERVEPERLRQVLAPGEHRPGEMGLAQRDLRESDAAQGGGLQLGML